ncbi:MAG: hypothetical protein M0Q91_17595 [Methanoregula sp.]|nr:hypothetical protein [Methanoregula sp.]
MKLTVRFAKNKPDHDEIAEALSCISRSIREGYKSGIGMPCGVLSWDLRNGA